MWPETNHPQFLQLREMPEKPNIFCRKFLSQYSAVFKEEICVYVYTYKHTCAYIFIFRQSFPPLRHILPICHTFLLVLHLLPLICLLPFTHSSIFARSAASIPEFQKKKDHNLPLKTVEWESLPLPDLSMGGCPSQLQSIPAPFLAHHFFNFL